jgi:hypothetical protein
MRDRIEAAEVIFSDIADILVHRRNRFGCDAEITFFKILEIEADYLMTAGLQDRHHDRSDIARVARNQYSL